MTYEETVAVVYRIVSAYPSQASRFSEEIIESMAREWHIGLKHIPADGVMEAVTMLTTEQKWMPSLSEVIGKILDVQYGADEEIIRQLDNTVTYSSTCIIFGRVTDDQIKGYNNLTPFEKRIIQSPYEFSMWMMKGHEWKAERVLRAKREIQHGSHNRYLESAENQIGNQIGKDFIKALAEKNNYGY